ncbi:MAG: DUF3419 family protein [Actinomycetota bacterium]
MNPSPAISDQLAQEVVFDAIRYANCWEDGDLLLQALNPAPGKRILSIASAGDNSLLLLSRGTEVVAADLSAAQLACTELRCQAICALDDDEALAFFGFFPASDRSRTYQSLRDRLSPAARAFWDAHPGDIRNGIIHAGKFERYFRLFRRRILPLSQSRSRVNALLTPGRSHEEHETFFRTTWNHWRWRLLFHAFFNRRVMGRAGRDPAFFNQVQGSVAHRILARCEHALVTLDPAANPWLGYILTGNFTHPLPAWTHPDTLAGIRTHAHRLHLFHGGIEDAAAAHGAEGFDGFNLSDLFEYLTPDATETLYTQLIDTARPGARLAYWNLLVPRARPASLHDRVQPLTDLAADLHARDRTFFYSAFHVDEVRP